MRGLGALIALMLAAAAAAAQTPEPTPPAGPLVEPRQSGSLMVISDDPCCEVLSTISLPSGYDSAVVEAHRDRAFRWGPVLQLKLVGDRSLRIIDRRPGLEHSGRYYSCILDDYRDACRFHRLVDWWADQRYYVIHVSLHEASDTFLVDERDGRIIGVAAPPVRSPSGRHAVAFDFNMMSGRRLELIDLGTWPPRLLPVEAGPTCQSRQDLADLNHLRPTPRWLDDSRVTFEGKPFFENDDPSAKQILRIVDGKPEWEC
jgi:hypothetical protein